MISEFKKSLAQYLIVLIFLSAVFVVIIIPTTSPLGFLSPITKFLLLTLSLFVAHTLAAVISTKTGNKEFQRIASILMTDCDVNQFFAESTPLLKKGSRQSNLAKYILLSNAYLAKGDYSEVMQILEKAIQDSNVDWITEEMKHNMCHIYRNACIASVEMDQSKQAINLYSKLSDLSLTINNSANFKQDSESVKLFTRDYIGVFTKPSMDVSQLEETFSSSSSNYYKLMLAHILTRYFQKNKNNAKKNFYNDYILENKSDCFTSMK